MSLVHQVVTQPEEGLAAASEGLTIVNQNAEHVYEAELYRLKGELTLQQARQKAKIRKSRA